MHDRSHRNPARFALVAWLVYFVVGLLPLPPVAKQIALAVMGVLFLLWLLEFLMPGGGIGLRGLR